MAVARALSIVGHPALVMPVAVAASTIGRQAPQPAVLAAVAAAAAVAVVVGIYSALQVRAGRWAHVDASRPAERSHLHALLGLLFIGIGALLWASGQPPAIVAGPAACGAIVGLAYALRHWLKLSLHCAFVALAAGLLWPLKLPVLALAGLALAVGWSRIRLGRHSRTDVLAGLACGAAAGWAFNLVALRCC